MSWRKEYQEKLCTAQEAVRPVKDGDVVHIGTSSGIAWKLTEALYERRDELEYVTISSAMSPIIPQIYRDESGPFHFLTYFAGPAEREAMKHNNCNYTSIHLSRIDKWCEDFLKGGTAFIEVSPPDEHGYMSYGAYGVSMHDFVKEACARVVVQVNKKQPYVYGQRNKIHVSEVDAIVEAENDLAQVQDIPADEPLKRISSHIVEQIPDGATIQLGLGGVSGAVGYRLMQKNDLGIHSEMFTNSMKHLMEAGVVTNKKKSHMPGKSVAAFAFGPTELYDFLDHNENLYFAPYTVVNDPYEIAKNDNMISVNTAMSIDLYGQVAADSMAGRQQSGVGGQVDYVRGAQMSKGGKSFVAVPSIIKNKQGRGSRIVASFAAGTAVTTSRQDIQYVVTEYGCVNLKPLTMRERALALIELAHPDFREELKEQAKDLGIL